MNFSDTMNGGRHIYALCYPNGVPFYIGQSHSPARLLGHYSEARRPGPAHHTLKNQIIRDIVGCGELVGFRVLYKVHRHLEDDARRLESLAMWLYEGRLANVQSCPLFNQMTPYSDGRLAQWVAQQRRELNSELRYCQLNTTIPNIQARIIDSKFKLAILKRRGF